LQLLTLSTQLTRDPLNFISFVRDVLDPKAHN
jgi:hypothetical protein